MRYIILTKLEYPTSVSLKVKGLPQDEIDTLKQVLHSKGVKYTDAHRDYFEVDIVAVEMLNLLCNKTYSYKIVTQAMAMELSELGGRSFQIEKIVWTLGKEDSQH